MADFTSAKARELSDLFAQYKESDSAQVHLREIKGERQAPMRALADHVAAFRSGSIDLETFRSTFDRKARSEWGYFGLSGPAGAMFLNMIVKNLKDQKTVAEVLKTYLPAPRDDNQASRAIDAFVARIKELAAAENVPIAKVQPARAPFILSALWHMQSTESWPIYYPNSRSALEKAGLYHPTDVLGADYTMFKAAFAAAQKQLGSDSWTTESFFSWLSDHDVTVIEPPTHAAAPRAEEPGEQPAAQGEEETHTSIQFILAELGKALRCQVWIAGNDHKKKRGNETLGDLSLRTLPSLGLDDVSVDHIRLIDVLWLRGNQVCAAFEIEHSTSVYSGILRMADLVAVAPNLNFPLYLVIPSDREEKVRRELSRPAFRQLEMPERCAYITYEKLIAEAPAIRKYSNDPEVILRLATRVK